MKEEKRHSNKHFKSTDIFLVKNSSYRRASAGPACRPRQVYKSFQMVVALALVALSVFSFIVSSPTAFASTADNYSGLVKCSGVVENSASGEVPCDFNTFISMLASVINWLFVISVPIAVAIFAYAGLLYMTGASGNKEKAKTIFKNVAFGFIIMLVAFTVVHTLIGWIVDPNFGAESLLSV